MYYQIDEFGFFESLEIGVRRYSSLGEVVIAGDLNARCGNRLDFIQPNGNIENFIPTIDCNDLESKYADLKPRESRDKVCNSSDVKLLDICKSPDLRIANGRIGDDTNTGDYTFLSSKGSGLIDYVLMSESLFPYVSSFIIHDLYDCSSHVLVQVSFTVQIDTTHTEQGKVNIEKKNIWNPSMAQEFKEKNAT